MYVFTCYDHHVTFVDYNGFFKQVFVYYGGILVNMMVYSICLIEH